MGATPPPPRRPAPAAAAVCWTWPPPCAFRLYLGGSDPTLLGVGQGAFHGMIYAPTARVSWVGEARVDGSLFVRALDTVGDVIIGHRVPQASAATDPCPYEDASDETPWVPDL